MKKKSVVILMASASLAAFVLLLLLTYWRPEDRQAAVARGEEVYASHDCTDCHLSAPVLKQKKEKGEVGLIRVRRSIPELLKFLEGDKRHESYALISANDRADLIEYLKGLVY